MSQAKYIQADLDHNHAQGYVVLRCFLEAVELGHFYADVNRIVSGWRQAIDPAERVAI